METAALVFLGLALFFFCGLLFCTLLDAFDVANSYEACKICFFCFLFFTIIGVILLALPEKQIKPEVKEYPLTEWKMDYKVTMLGEKTDTTLVLTKIR